MRVLSIIAIIVSAFGCASSPQPEAALFSYDSKEMGRDDLPEAMRHKLFNVQVKYYQDAMQIIRDSVIEIYLTELASNQGKSFAEVKAEVFKSQEPTDEEKKAFYETMKEKLPYSYDVVKHEIGPMLLENRVRNQEKELIKEIEKSKGIRVYLRAPNPPEVKIETEPYPQKGERKAKVQLVEFGDFSCPNCRLAVDAVEKLMVKYKDKIEFTWRYFLLHAGGASLNLAKGGHCAHAQGKFWDYYFYVFGNQEKLLWKAPTTFVKEIKGIEENEFNACYSDPKTKEIVTKSHEEGKNLGVESTPTFFVNGKRIVFGSDFKGIEQAIQEAL